MKRFKVVVLITLGLFVLSFCIALFLGGSSLFSKIIGSIGFILLMLGAIFSNRMGSGDRIRVNFATEDAEDRKRRETLWTVLFLVGVGCIIMALVVALM